MSLFVALIAGSSLRPRFSPATLPEPAAWTHSQVQSHPRGPTHEPSRPWLSPERYAEDQEALPQHVDDARSADQLDPPIASVRLVGVAVIVC
ncbi:hypothetical protein I547_5612 [Mycobacterium kansasii 824]|nr:hypothetical protein I547_5612 [Mycobacterium kansasii 824]